MATPLNVLHVPFAPFLLTTKNPQCLNTFILYIGYIPILIIAILLFIVYNIVIYIPAYTKLFFHKLVMIFVYSKSYRSSRADKFMSFVIFGALGLFILLLNMIVDIGYFTKHLLSTDLQKTKHKTSDKQISKKHLAVLLQYFKIR